MSSNITPITMPKFGLAMTEGKLASWSLPVGTEVSAGDELADIETSKITNGYESPAAGILRRQVIPEGETIPVGTLIGILADADVSDVEIDSFIKNFNDNFSSGETKDKASEETPRRIVEVDDLRISIQESGNGNEGTAVLLIHGFGGDVSNWMLTQSALSSSHHVIAFDLPGHGESTKQVGDGSPEGFAKTVESLIKILDLPNVHVIGHSLGGAIALELAKSSPELVKTLTLIAPAGLGQDINMNFINGFIEADRRKTLEPVLQYLVHDKNLISRQMVEGIIRYKRLDGVINGLKTIASASFPEGKQAVSLRSTLEKFDKPSQILWGEQDEILSAKDADGLPSTIAVTRYPDAGHMPQLEQAAAVNAIISSFIA
ncbi:MAG: acetoin dehydrogenase dihydrolipoyllysine-residue acetyltransferase subunit [Acetobacter sp.]|nr:acetoin dehydrogenase dihydrolipoyllysine-residue acetyltransferase subunit [Acetobacter sp.]